MIMLVDWAAAAALVCLPAGAHQGGRDGDTWMSGKLAAWLQDGGGLTWWWVVVQQSPEQTAGWQQWRQQ
jgi:hypothetical protein